MFAGTINGTRWWAKVGCCSLRAISVGSEVEGGGGAISNDQLSQPNDEPATETHYMITGVATAGAVIAGYTEPAATTVVLLDRGRTVAELPVVHAHGAAFFAVPVPTGLHVDTLTIRAGTIDLHQLAIPPIPAALVGSYGFG